MAAVQQNGYAIKYVNDQTFDLCMAAVQQNGGALVHVKDQTFHICMAAVQQDGWTSVFIFMTAVSLFCTCVILWVVRYNE
jgi:hypothetical protein